MVLLRKLLFPFAVLYGAITQFRNFLYDKGILKSYRFDLPVIAVGNLTVGGTGKTPMIEYLIRLLSDKHRVATLSRGYKRRTKGFILADKTSTPEILGDEPYQLHDKFPNIAVAVDADRKNGIERLLSIGNKPEVILLDDAFQHRKVKAGFYILLTSYGDLYSDDFMLPTGNLREGRCGADRADLIVITKCPPDLLKEEQEKLKLKLKVKRNQEVYFTFTDYDNNIYSENINVQLTTVRQQPKLLVAGIAKPGPFFSYLRGEHDITMQFRDHNYYSDADVSEILQKAGKRIIVTTEKDFVRLKGKLPSDQLFYLPIQTKFFAAARGFDGNILDFVNSAPR